jgi:hypothetical protein
LLIEDLSESNVKVKQVRVCDEDDAAQFKFSNHIRLTLTLGTFLSDASGFIMRYNGTIKEEEEQVEPTVINETTTSVPTPGKSKKMKKTTRTGINQNLDNDQSDISEPKTAKIVEVTDKTPPPGPYPGLFIISVIVVAILLIIILGAAGAIACYRNHQQEQIINSMHDRLSDIHGTGYSPVDGSHTSLRNKMRMPENANLGVSGSIVVQKTTEEDHRLLSSPESSESQK